MQDGEWKTLGSDYVYENPWCAFRVDEVELPDGAAIEYGVMESGGFVAVLPVTEEGRVILVRQWRQPLGKFTLELPSGGIDENEEPRKAAGRELLEETGYRAEELESLAFFHTSTGRSTEACHLFRCRAVRDPGGPRHDTTEFIDILEVSTGEILERIADGEISDAATIIGVQSLTGSLGPGMGSADTLH